jgi:crotonobetainyl-CoA:carnitine CoA-transferase CaiB-like acyl-CoA transferase
MMAVHTLIQVMAGTGRGIAELTGSTISYCIYETADGRYVSLAALEKKFWENFCRAVGREEWLPDLYSPADPDNGTFNEVTALFKGKSFAEWAAFSQKVDCCMTPVLETSEVISYEYVQNREIASRGGQVPALGQHNQEVYTGLLAATVDQIRGWQERGII